MICDVGSVSKHVCLFWLIGSYVLASEFTTQSLVRKVLQLAESTRNRMLLWVVPNHAFRDALNATAHTIYIEHCQNWID